LKDKFNENLITNPNLNTNTISTINNNFDEVENMEPVPEKVHITAKYHNDGKSKKVKENTKSAKKKETSTSKIKNVRKAKVAVKNGSKKQNI
jgi:hypothetical protein